MSDSPPSDGPSVETYHQGRKRTQAALTGLVVSIAAVCSILRWKPFRVEIGGDSMDPTLLPGDQALAVILRRLRRGQVVVLEHPERPGFEMVKRITGVEGDLAPDGRTLSSGELWVEGDNRARSTDSRHFGSVTRDRVKATIRLIYWPPSRRRLLRP